MATHKPAGMLTSAEVAERLEVDITRVYKLRAENQRGGNNFPHPRAYQGRSPLYAATDVDAYISERSRRTPSSRGRLPRVREASSIDVDNFPSRLRDAIRSGAGAPEITTQRDLIELLGLNTVTFGQRMRERTRWKPSELELIEKRLQIDTTDARRA